MPPRSKVETLPPELKAWLDAEMVRRGFGDYVQLAADLEARGAGIPTPSKSALQRYGSVYELRMAQLKSSVQMAGALVDAAPDDEDKMGSALIRLAQEKMMDLMMRCDLDPADVDMNKLFKSIAEVSKASSINAKARLEIRERMAARAQEVAASVAKTVKKAGLSDDTINAIKSQILGIPEVKGG